MTCLSVGDFHDSAFDNPSVETDYSPFKYQMQCKHTLSLYPTYDFQQDYKTNKPATYTATVAVLFAFMIFVFFDYDCPVERRQTKVMTAAKSSTAIVSILFPSTVADRLMEDAGKKSKTQQQKAANKQPKMGKLHSKDVAYYSAEPKKNQLAENMSWIGPL